MQLTVRGSSSSVTAGRQLASTSSSGSARKALMFAARGQQGATTASSTAADDSSKGTITTTTTAALTTASVTTDSAAAATLMKVKAAPLADPLLSESFERFALAESGFGAARPPLAPAASGDAMMHVIPFQQISWYPRITYYPGRSSRSF